jgi:general stress protein YciG
VTRAEEITALRREMGREGGQARARALTPERRSEIARQGSRAYWDAMDPEQRRERALKAAKARKGKL